ncbi:putative leucine-rich repeat receptor-like serine/threonine-protein kinase [Hibiscus syriacus]|uniref:non-specific serine/threonine protein kinase n=1 Tax=Hibiscus syriacus TaxID=106335 RepID=A0A6A2Y6J0_HIBSY|nr:probable leucine-rich repeat receptor-like serine/threonine-protein kinase At3g14840 [Hibiscus syriacus]KAE8680080.1 putative leucine-rich repeat receptor-like serine/threonine-protein kinase [Hibiscus syriacus]
MFVSRLVLASISLACCLSGFVFGATLTDNEVQYLKDIGKTLGKNNWNFNVDPCSGEEGWTTANPMKGFENSVTCNCSFTDGNNTVCHVVSIILKAQNLQGSLPKDLVKFSFLQEIDLSRNFLNATIPPEWGSMQLVNISLLGNRLTGRIPKELGNISTLTSLTTEFNQLSGTLPPELGNLPAIERLLLSSNNFTGEVPETFTKLTTLRDFRISDNQFTGQIPSFIQNWTKLEKLVIQASGLMGPIPSGVGDLIKLTDLRISDLNGNDATFPPLSSMKKLKILILRSCNLIGKLPDYLGDMTKLKTLDLSFNKLSGDIPSSFSGLMDVDNLYLTRNLLTGSVPSWILEKGDNVDLSYNNFAASQGTPCQQRTVNLFASSSSNDISGTVSCLRSFGCLKSWYSLHINCGGREVVIGGNTTYEDDADGAGASRFYESRTNWAFSSTGHFLDDDHPSDAYIWTNSSKLSMNDSRLYMNARLSPISLAYYGFCMGNGNYTVNLHFAEIMFTNDNTYSSLGRRIFDIYLQGKLVQKDFNIAGEAGGVGKAVIKKFPAAVTNSTLEIRLQWAGKGTTAIPVRGVYGPLISAISVNPDFIPPAEDGGSSGRISVGAVVGIAAGSVFAIFLVGALLWWKGCLRKKSQLERDLQGLDLQTGSFSLRQIKSATNNFDVANKIGEGGFGPVYKGILADGTVVAVKQLSSKSKQGNREFVNEIGMISALQHPHLVKLFGCCIEGNQLLLIYEYMENNSLARALFGPQECQLKLDWPTRRKICIGIARGSAYLHEESRLKIVHRDIKATNVLLDRKLNPKISDFGLAKLDEEDNSHISTRVAGTYGYMAPEYAMRGYLTDKADVYSFGIVLLEIVSGRGNTSCRSKHECFYLLDWVHVLKEEGNLLDLVDPRIGHNYKKEEVTAMINVALLCTDINAAARPAMSSVVSMLEGKASVQKIKTYSSRFTDRSSSKAMVKKLYQHLEENSAPENQTHSMSAVGPWISSSSSTADLYPVTITSEYWQNRDSAN